MQGNLSGVDLRTPWLTTVKLKKFMLYPKNPRQPIWPISVFDPGIRLNNRNYHEQKVHHVHDQRQFNYSLLLVTDNFTEQYLIFMWIRMVIRSTLNFISNLKQSFGYFEGIHSQTSLARYRNYIGVGLASLTNVAPP